MKQGLKWATTGLSMLLTVCTLVAVAENYEWETKINGVDVELKGTAPQVNSKKLQNECVIMASYAIQQFRINGGRLDPKTHDVECQVGSNGRVSALLEGDSKEDSKDASEKQTYLIPETLEPIKNTPFSMP